MSEFLATCSHPQDDKNPRTLQGRYVNRRMVYGAFESGIGKEGVAKFCEILNMPFNMSHDTWYNHEEILCQSHQEVTREQLQKNCTEARKLAMLDEGIDDDDEDEDITVDIPISFDGTWSRNLLKKFMIVSVSQHCSSDACLGTPKMPMSLSMHWHGTSVLSISGMAESELLWLHHLLLCTSVAVPQKSLMSWQKMKFYLANIVGRKQKEEIVGEFSKQSTGLKNNINGTD